MDSIKASRDTAKVEAALAALTASANEYDETPDRSSNSHNLLNLAVAAARERATVGDISDALEEAWGRHTPTLSVTAGAYSSVCSAVTRPRFVSLPYHSHQDGAKLTAGSVVRQRIVFQSQEFGEDDVEIVRVRDKTAEFSEKHGRRPRLLVAKLGQDGHE